MMVMTMTGSEDEAPLIPDSVLEVEEGEEIEIPQEEQPEQGEQQDTPTQPQTPEKPTPEDEDVDVDVFDEYPEPEDCALVYDFATTTAIELWTRTQGLELPQERARSQGAKLAKLCRIYNLKVKHLSAIMFAVGLGVDLKYLYDQAKEKKDVGETEETPTPQSSGWSSRVRGGSNEAE
jgi:hypothetical protein